MANSPSRFGSVPVFPGSAYSRSSEQWLRRFRKTGVPAIVSEDGEVSGPSAGTSRFRVLRRQVDTVILLELFFDVHFVLASFSGRRRWPPTRVGGHRPRPFRAPACSGGRRSGYAWLTSPT